MRVLSCSCIEEDKKVDYAAIKQLDEHYQEGEQNDNSTP